MASLHEIAAELYGLPPDEFTAARTTAEKEARSAGDRELAAQVKALRRPAVAAWAVNQLVRQRADLVHQVVALGESLREAQSLLQGNALRELTRQRRRLVTAVTAQVKELAADQGQRLSDAATRQVEETLQAAMADLRAAEALGSGLLAQPLSSTGLESLAEVLAVPLDEVEGEVAPAGPPTLTVVQDDERPLRDAEERVEQAGKAVRKATKARDKLRGKREKAQAKVLQLEAELEELRRQVAQLEGRTEEAAEGLTELDAELEEAEAELSDAAEEAEAASKALKKLRKR